MTLQLCKASLLDLIGDQENNVIALSGKWGTGKTFLWQMVREETTNTRARDAVSVSLFGVSSINDLKLRIIQAVMPKLKNDNRVAEAFRAGVGGVKKVLKSIHSGFGALDELAMLATPYLLHERFIIIDDIERKHGKRLANTPSESPD